jgi:RNA polymerase sigma factor (sigma-70 family)
VSADARFDALYRQHAGAVGAYLLRRASHEDALEAAAETFVVAWRRLDEVPEAALPWLLGVARRQLANVRRGNERRLALVRRLTSAGELGPPQPDSGQGGQGGQGGHILAAMARLRPDDQEVLRLVAWDGLSAREAAAVLGCSDGALRVRLHRARQRLEQELSMASTDVTGEPR